MHTDKKIGVLHTASKTVGMLVLFGVCGTIAFFLGLQSVDDGTQIDITEAQAVTQVSVILQYLPLGATEPVPIEISPILNDPNTSVTSLLEFHEVHLGIPFPSERTDRCNNTNPAGRCTLDNLPLGPNPNAGVDQNQQYDIVVNTRFIEFLTGIPLETAVPAFIRFDQSACGATAFAFDLSSSVSDRKWCLGNTTAPEYFLTFTLHERDQCRDLIPPAPFCDAEGPITTFTCNPDTLDPLSPWERVVTPCDVVQCPDGNSIRGSCEEIAAGLPACSTAATCADHQVCSVHTFGSHIRYEAGEDTLIIRGERFGTQGGTVRFPTIEGGKEIVQVTGSNWNDTEIAVAIPQRATTGVIEIHPNTHGSTENAGVLTPVTCSSPSLTIRPITEQFSILNVSASSAGGVQLVSPGFNTELQIQVQHGMNVSDLSNITVELVEGAYPTPNSVPLQHTTIFQSSCPVAVLGSSGAQESLLGCSVLIPQNAANFDGPFTFLVSVFDKNGNREQAVLLDGGTSALAGDFNQDGVLTIFDAVLAKRFSLGTAQPTQEQLLRDTDDDNAITINDVFFVLHSLTQR